MISGLVRVPGTNLQTKFRNIGTLKGQTRSEIEVAVGPANSVSAAEDGKTVCQWMATGYLLAYFLTGISVTELLTKLGSKGLLE